MRRADQPSRRAFACGVTLMLAAALSGCGLGLESLPLAGPGGQSNSYTLTAMFTNALNLPAKAKVKLNGADIGEVQSIRATNFSATVTMRIRDSVRLHDGLTAELRSATPLGDLFVAMHPGTNPSARPLHNGDTISLASTNGGATVEEVLSSAALLVNGGVLRNLTTILNGAGAAVGGKGTNVKALLNTSTALIARLNTRSAQIKSALDSTNDLATTLAAHQTSLDAALAAAAPATSVIADNIDQIANLTATAARITRQLARFPSLRGTDSRSLIADMNHLSAAFNDVTVDPTISLNDINRLIPVVMKTTNSNAIHGAGEITQLALGSLPDKNYPGDPMFHGPDGTDWHAMVGSLRYEWNLMLGRIYGPDR